MHPLYNNPTLSPRKFLIEQDINPEIAYYIVRLNFPTPEGILPKWVISVGNRDEAFMYGKGRLTPNYKLTPYFETPEDALAQWVEWYC